MNAKSVVRSYWDGRSQTYSIDIYKSRSEAEHLWKTLLKNTIRTNRNLRILDVGTGTGFLALLLAEMGHNVTGIDISKRMLEKSRQNADAMHLSIDFMHGDAEKLPFEDEMFDIVVNRNLLWTLPDPMAAACEWSRVVKSGGKLVLIDGKWHDSATDMRLRRFLGSLVAFVTERQNPMTFTSYYSKIKDQLPFFSGSDPDDVANLFSKVGLTNVSVNRLERLMEFENKNRSISYNIANNPSLFMALGEK
ncbi:MAG: methyltransferase domain-containing protein [Euryarchaeota archaeon]|nr:methyltransferase domain-containing protein [Euryarchaeota archaeon]